MLQAEQHHLEPSTWTPNVSTLAPVWLLSNNDDQSDRLLNSKHWLFKLIVLHTSKFIKLKCTNQANSGESDKNICTTIKQAYNDISFQMVK